MIHLLLAACITWTAPSTGAAVDRVRPSFSPVVAIKTATAILTDCDCGECEAAYLALRSAGEL